MRRKERIEELEQAYESVLAEKLELEYQYENLNQRYLHEKDQREETLELRRNVRKLKHDMKNHIMVIAAYLQENAIEETKAYLSEVLDKLNGMYTYIETGNSLMSHILNQKLEYAQRQGILVKAQIENLAFAQMESVDFVSMLTNLLDNAVEGAGTPADGKPPAIHVTIAKKRGYETVLVQNTIQESVLKKNPDLKTDKQEKELHGFGIGQLRSIAKKYHGLCQFYEEDGMFSAAVMIPF